MLFRSSGKSATDYHRKSCVAYNAANTAINSSLVGQGVGVIDGMITTGASAGTVIVRAASNLTSGITVNSTLSTIEVW